MRITNLAVNQRVGWCRRPQINTLAGTTEGSGLYKLQVNSSGLRYTSRCSGSTPSGSGLMVSSAREYRYCEDKRPLSVLDSSKSILTGEQQHNFYSPIRILSPQSARRAKLNLKTADPVALNSSPSDDSSGHQPCHTHTRCPLSTMNNAAGKALPSYAGVWCFHELLCCGVPNLKRNKYGFCTKPQVDDAGIQVGQYKTSSRPQVL
ncbi:hypothetical protein E2C01_030280 [Portunus trituberculatus]|uniref:Uncharacterized protein n=1 Tax=Portunus trituberculatus TaxID=210409 RepID=A0A5B7EVA1_PORTR|nr:hypothetical protein [Portunus trituberculatus]